METKKKTDGLEILARNVETIARKAKTFFLRAVNSETSANAENPLFSEQDVVYIAGPMTGKPLFNYVQFFGVAGLIEKEYGCRVLNPARQPNGLTYDQYLELALEDVERATAIVLLNGWEFSPGARREISFVATLPENMIPRIVTEKQLFDDLNKRIFAKK